MMYFSKSTVVLKFMLGITNSPDSQISYLEKIEYWIGLTSKWFIPEFKQII